MNKLYCVYMHIFPDGKKYIGITCDTIEKRWRNGHGYKSKKMNDAIQKFGWDNIDHIVILENLDKAQAEKLERFLIGELDTVQNGYNTDAGGSIVTRTFFDSYILRMCEFVRKHKDDYYRPRGYEDEYTLMDMVSDIYEQRYDKEFGELMNWASDAVTKKHGKFRTQDEVDVSTYWFYIGEFLRLHQMVLNGEGDKWRERNPREIYWEAITSSKK